MQKIHTISTQPVMNTVSNTSTTSDLIASVVAGHAINNKNNNSNKKINSSVAVSNNNNNNRAANINENGSPLKIVKPLAPAKPNGRNGNFGKIFICSKNWNLVFYRMLSMINYIITF